jgi:glycine/D-amino acid oxidase-like deaminating enzyme
MFYYLSLLRSEIDSVYSFLGTDAFRGFLAYQTVHGTEQALKIIANERLVLEKVDEFVKKYNVDCDFDYTTTFDVCMTEMFAAYEGASLKAFERAGGDISHIQLYEGKQAQEKTRVKGAVRAYEWPAGSSHPAKLTQWLLQRIVSDGVQLFTHCPVTQVIRPKSGDKKYLWEVCTARGSVTTPTVIHCTNAHAGLLLPGVARHLTPNRAQAHSLIPTSSFSGSDVLKSTFSLRYSRLHFYSLIQRKGDGTLILGVSRHNPTLSESTKAGIVSFDDSHYNNEILQVGLTQFGNMFPESAANPKAHGEGVDHAWTGIIGMTADSVPFVGALDGLPGQFICAGHNGHGE